MKVLLDQGLPRSTVKALGDRGIDAEHVGQVGMATASDEEILEAGRARDAVVVTLDADFHSLLAAAHALNPSVIRIRIEGLKGEDIALLIEQVIGSGQTELETGAAVRVTTGGIRIRLLPLVLLKNIIDGENRPRGDSQPACTPSSHFQGFAASEAHTNSLSLRAKTWRFA